jgi:UDPglucose--hexose-1-phosphate uridylyltransferase
VDPRVGAFATEGVPDTRACPFCPGHESETEGTVDAVLDAHGAWRVRVVRNRFPMVSPEAVLAHPAPGGRELPGRGVAEVIVEAREHDAELPDYSREHAAAVLRMYRDRLRALEAAPGVRAVSVFKNHGRRAGSSQ